jgi:hypothetical protein
MDSTEYMPPTLSFEDGNTSSFQNVVFFRILDNGQGPKSQQSQVSTPLSEHFRIKFIKLLSSKFTFHVSTLSEFIVIFLKIQPMQFLSRVMVSISF